MGTRAKTKKVKDAGEARQDVLRKVAASKELSFMEKGKLYHWDRPLCQGDRVNSKDSPNCLCALIPPPNGHRKQGLWQKTPEAVLALGEDPSYRKRKSFSNPIGLTNLGATCYVNSILQCLFMNVDFRRGLFLVEEDLLMENPVLRQLCLLFVKLQMSNEDPVDPTVFAGTLQLDNGVQQDGQEFMKLLLTLLEKLLGQSNRTDVQKLVQGLFRGTYSYVTRCSVCGNESESSKNLVDFYELEVNVKGFEVLEQSLNDYLSEEVLEGDNQYMCEHCNRRVDATRSVKLRSLPPLLNFQLKRFVFNNKTGTKKKVTSRFSFPITFNLEPQVSAPAASIPDPKPNGQKASEGVYDLVAILVHKGSMATSGHYIAHIKDERTGDWWQFDDEVVTSLGAHPLGEAAASAELKKESKPQAKGDPLKDGKESEVILEGAKGVAAVDKRDPNMLTSADSYMLMYRRRDERQVAFMQRHNERRQRKAEVAKDREETTEKDKKRKSVEVEKTSKRARTGKKENGMSSETPVAVDLPLRAGFLNGEEAHASSPSKRDGGDGSLTKSEAVDFKLDPQPPKALVEEVEKGNVAFLAAIKSFESEKERILAEVNGRRKEVRETLNSATVPPDQWDFRWISFDWLRSWADSKDPPGPIDNTPLLCEHGKVPPQNVGILKRVSKDTWGKLHATHGGGPELSASDCCGECIRRDADAAQNADSFRTIRTAMRERLEQEMALGVPGTHYISKTWLSNWLRKRLVDAPSDADKGPTAPLRCPHDGLKPDFAPGAKRQIVSGDFWAYIQGVAEEVAGSDDSGHWEIPASTSECETCRVQLGEEMSTREGLKSGKLAEKAQLDSLFSGRPTPLSDGVNAFLVPTKWLDSWRDYLGATGKTLDLIGEPPSLEDAFTPLFCTHGNLAVQPPELMWKKNEVVQAPKESTLTLVSEPDWRQLQNRWRSSVEIIATATIASRQPDPKDSRDNGRGRANGRSGEEGGGQKEAKAGASKGKKTAGSEDDVTEAAKPAPVLVTIPEICEACHKERLDADLAERLSYRQQEIIVELFQGSRPPAHVTATSAEGERRSKRSRKASSVGGGRMTLKVNADTTVNDLKMTIWERMEVDTVNQRLGFHDKELIDVDASLAECGIVANSRLWLINTGEHANRDIVECFEPEEEAGELENGFKGTGLWASDYVSSKEKSPVESAGALALPEGTSCANGTASVPKPATAHRETSKLEEKASVGVNKGSLHSGADRGKRWSCERCTLENSPGKQKCSACEAKRCQD